MAENSPHIIHLLEKYSSGQASSGEMDQLFTLLRTGDYDETVVSFIETHLETFEPRDAEDIAFWKSRLEGGSQKITGTSGMEPAAMKPTAMGRVHFLRRGRWAAAAILLALGIGGYLWTTHVRDTPAAAAVAKNTYIAPGKNGAILTLADGKQVVLDSLGNGMVATQNGTQVLIKGGGLAYDAAGSNTDAAGSATREVMYNTMTTPKGRQFQVTLPDGTMVWLNAASSLHFPTVFTGGERQVTVTGEAYFEVARNTNMPFKVNVNGKAVVEVLGTHFNVNAYDNEDAINTTLLKGSVRVSQIPTGLAQGQPSVTLEPGQQAQIAHHSRQAQSKTQSGIKLITDADLNKVMAWKNGLFNFEGASLVEVMRQIERWYDIDVIYEKGIPNIEFEGKMTKDVPLKDLLVMLEKSDIHFRIEDSKLIVLP